MFSNWSKTRTGSCSLLGGDRKKLRITESQDHVRRQEFVRFGFPAEEDFAIYLCIREWKRARIAVATRAVISHRLLHCGLKLLERRFLSAVARCFHTSSAT